MPNVIFNVESRFIFEYQKKGFVVTLLYKTALNEKMVKILLNAVAAF